MCEPKRDPDHKLSVNQSVWQAVATGGQTVYLKFENNSFRKHFVLPPKATSQATSTEQKALNKQRKRALLAPAARTAEIIKRSEQRQLEKRYGSPAAKSRVIDLSVIDLRTALLDIANQLLQEGIGAELREVKFRLSRNCVIKTKSEFETAAEKTTIKVTAGSDRKQTIKLKVKLKDSQYVFG